MEAKNIFVSIIATAAGLALLYGFLIEPRRLKLIHYRIKLKDLPPFWQKKKIIFITDLHAGSFYPPSRIKKIVDKINEQQPDLILIGGDFVEEKTKIKDLAFKEEYIKVLSELKSAHGIFSVLGNHDTEAKENYAYVKSLLKEAKISLLENESINLSGFLIVGLKESYHQQPDLDAAMNKRLASLAKEEYTARIILIHQPDDLPQPDQTSASDLILSGHSHGGQITLFGLPLYTVRGGREKMRGLYTLTSKAQQITSSGLGMVHIYARFFRPPEIVLIEIEEG